MNKLDEFKLFVKNNPRLIDKVQSKEYSWQQLYEAYDIYGESHPLFSKKINNEKDEIKKELLIERSEEFKKLNSTSKEYYSNFFIMVYSTSKDDIDLIADSLASEISKCGISTEFLSFKETAIFLKYNYTRNFDEKELDSFEMNKEQIIDWINPKEIIFQNNKYTIDNQELSTIAISDYPLKVKNGWGGELFNIPNTKVVMRINQIEKVKPLKESINVY